MTLASCLERADIWRGGQTAATTGAVVPSGFDELDDHLPGGGWPLGALTEILVEDIADSPLWLVMPALRALGQQKHWQAWITPPNIPFAPALIESGIDLPRVLIIRPGIWRDILWATEQTLGSGSCSAVLFWPKRPDSTALRRLQLAAERGRTLGLCFRDHRSAGAHSTAALRLLYQPSRETTQLSILKCRGGRLVEKLKLVRCNSTSDRTYAG